MRMSEATAPNADARRIVETITQPLLVLDRDLRVTYANPAFYRTFALTADASLGRRLRDLGDGQWQIPELARLLTEVLAVERPIVGHRIAAVVAGDHRVLNVTANCIPDHGRADRILVAIDDVTEPERLRFETEGQREFAEKLIDSVRESLVVLDWDLRVRQANQSFYETFHADPAETVGRRIYELGNGQWDLPELRALLERILPEACTFNDFEVDHTFDGIGRRLMLLNARRLDHTNLILLAIRDITGLKTAEAQLRELTASLEARVRDRTAALEAEIAERREAEAAAAAANKAKSEFLAAMSHELRTPLNAILGFSDALLSDVFGRTCHAVCRDYLGHIRGSGAHLLELVNQVLDMAKIEAGTLELSAARLDVADAIARAITLCGPETDGDGAPGITARLDDDLPALRVDELRLQQMLINLLANAKAHTPADGRITVDARMRDGELVVSVADTGCGMSPGDAERALQPFVQLESAWGTTGPGGAGLGLPLVKRLIALHGGRIELLSEPGSGTTVRLLFPPERVVPRPTPDPGAAAAPADG
jgi:two-component system CheB/CheR fusion protein